MRLNARIDAVKRTVGVGGNLQRAGHLEDHAGSRRKGENHVGTAAGALADQGDSAGLLKHGGYQIAAGEGRRGGEAVQVILFGNCVARIVVTGAAFRIAQRDAVQVQVCVVAGDGFRARHRVEQGNPGLSRKPAAHGNGRIRCAAAVQGEVDHDVFHRTAFPAYHPVRVDYQFDGILRIVRILQFIILFRLSFEGKGIKSDESGIADFLIAGNPVRERGHSGVYQLALGMGSCLSGIAQVRNHANQFQALGLSAAPAVSDDGRMPVVEEPRQDLGQCRVERDGIRPGQLREQARVQRQEIAEAVNAVLFFQAVEIIHDEAELTEVEQAVFFAHISRFHFVSLVHELTFVDVRDDLFAVENTINILETEKHVAYRLQGKIALVSPADNVNFVFPQVHGEGRSFPVVDFIGQCKQGMLRRRILHRLEAGGCLHLQCRRILAVPVFVHHFQHELGKVKVLFQIRKICHAHQRAGAGLVEEGIKIREGHGVVAGLDDPGALVVRAPDDENAAAVRLADCLELKGNLTVLIAFQDRIIHLRQNGKKFRQRHIGHVAVVHEIQIHFTGHRLSILFKAIQIGIGFLLDGISGCLAGFSEGRRTRQDQCKQ